MTQVRSPAVAGMFYPERTRELQAIVSDVLSDAASRAEAGPAPFTIVAHTADRRQWRIAVEPQRGAPATAVATRRVSLAIAVTSP